MFSKTQKYAYFPNLKAPPSIIAFFCHFFIKLFFLKHFSQKNVEENQ